VHECLHGGIEMVKTQIQVPEEDLKTWRRMAAEEGISV
jgi:hypothetical protein